jgi:hypothetical protein
MTVIPNSTFFRAARVKLFNLISPKNLLAESTEYGLKLDNQYPVYNLMPVTSTYSHVRLEPTLPL